MGSSSTARRSSARGRWLVAALAEASMRDGTRQMSASPLAAGGARAPGRAGELPDALARGDGGDGADPPRRDRRFSALPCDPRSTVTRPPDPGVPRTTVSPPSRSIPPGALLKALVKGQRHRFTVHTHIFLDELVVEVHIIMEGGQMSERERAPRNVGLRMQ